MNSRASDSDRGIADIKVMHERTEACSPEKLLTDEAYTKARESLADTDRRTLPHAMQNAINAFIDKKFLTKICTVLTAEMKGGFKNFYPYYGTINLISSFIGRGDEKQKIMMCGIPGLLKHCVDVIKDKKVQDLYFSLKPRRGIPSSHPDEMLRLLACLMITYEFSKLESEKQRMREHDVVDACLPYLHKGEDNVDKNVMIMTFYTVAYCADEKESKVFEGNPRILEYLVKLISTGQSNTQHTVEIRGYSTTITWGVDELLEGVLGLSTNDANKRLLDSYGMLEPLYKALRDNRLEEQKAALSILWNLSFNSEVEKKLTTDAKWIVEFEKLKISKNKDLSDAALGVLWNIRDEKEFIAKTQVKTVSKPELKKKTSRVKGSQAIKSGYVMISYQHSTQETILTIRDQLREQGNEIWIDVEQMTGSLLQKMAEAIEGADIVLMCICQRYKDSPNCRAEAEYAFARGKAIVPLVMEKGYRADGWLGILMGTKLFYDFSGKYPFEKKFGELMKEINGLKLAFNAPPAKTPEKEVKVALTPVLHQETKVQGEPKIKTDDLKKMSQNQVKEWVTAAGLQWEKYNFLKGKHIAFFQSLRQDSPAHFYSIIDRLTSGKLPASQLDDMVKFCDGMDKLQ